MPGQKTLVRLETAYAGIGTVMSSQKSQTSGLKSGLRGFYPGLEGPCQDFCSCWSWKDRRPPGKVYPVAEWSDSPDVASVPGGIDWC